MTNLEHLTAQFSVRFEFLANEFDFVFSLEMIPKNPEVPNREWNRFENAATSTFARSALWIDKNKDSQQNTTTSKTFVRLSSFSSIVSSFAFVFSKIDEDSQENMQMQINEVRFIIIESFSSC